MAKLHELLAAEKTPTGAWNQLFEDTLKKFKNPAHFFDGHSRSLAMIEDSPANKAVEDQNREEKPVTTTVFDTLDYALEIFGRAEDLQFQKNKTNQKAVGTVMWRGAPLLVDMPVDELLGLEARLTKLRLLYAEVPTLDARLLAGAKALEDACKLATELGQQAIINRDTIINRRSA